jgi:hypothetical protein
MLVAWKGYRITQFKPTPAKGGQPQKIKIQANYPSIRGKLTTPMHLHLRDSTKTFKNQSEKRIKVGKLAEIYSHKED